MSETATTLRVEIGQDSGIVLAALDQLRAHYQENIDRRKYVEYSRVQIQNISNVIRKLEAQFQ